MLVLSRKVGEKIYIGDEKISIVVTRIERGKIRLGIKAPREVPIYRQEIQDDINAGKPRPLKKTSQKTS